MTSLSPDGIRELAAFRPAGGVVTSCYLDVDGRRYPRRAEYEQELDRLLRSARTRGSGRTTVAADLDAIERHVKAGIDRARTRGLAMFSCAGEGFWQALALPVPVRNQIVTGHAPAVGQLEAVLQHQEPIGVLLVDRQHARVLVVELGEVSDHDELVDELLRDVDERDERPGGTAATRSRTMTGVTSGGRRRRRSPCTSATPSPTSSSARRRRSSARWRRRCTPICRSGCGAG